MPSGIIRQISGELAMSKSRGKSFSSALGSALSQKKIAATKPQTQGMKKKK
jgi:hypothetical protein